MQLGEFGLIEVLRKVLGEADPDLLIGMGDDAAVVRCPEALAVCSDTLVAGRHFFADVAASDLAWKALAVNLSDLAAMGATPRWALLNLSLPAGHGEDWGRWVDGFIAGWRAMAVPWRLRLIGGDTVATDGPLTITVVLLGAQRPAPMRRDAARPGQGIWVSGSLGDAAAALDIARSRRGLAARRPQGLSAAAEAALEQRRLRPSPRLALGEAAAGCGIGCAQDISDGFLADLGHILRASGVGARVDVDALPVSSALRPALGEDWSAWQRWPLTGGDDYELILCTAPELEQALLDIGRATDTPLTRVGEIVPASAGIELRWRGHVQRVEGHGGHEHVF